MGVQAELLSRQHLGLTPCSELETSIVASSFSFINVKRMQPDHSHHFRTTSDLSMDKLVTAGYEYLEEVKQKISANSNYWCCDHVFMCNVSTNG